MENLNDADYKEFMNILEVTKYLGVHTSTVYRYLRDIKIPLPSIKISRKKILVKKADLLDWLDKHRDTLEEEIGMQH